MITKHPTSLEEKELEGLRLEWGYQRGRSSYMIRRELRGAATDGCWTRGTLVELRQSQAAGARDARSAAAYFGVGHLAVRSGGVVYIARCGMVVVELRNHTYCTQENTGDASRRRAVCGSTEPGSPTIGNTCEMQEGGPP